MDLSLKYCVNMPLIDSCDATKIFVQQPINVDAIQSTATTCCMEKSDQKQSTI